MLFLLRKINGNVEFVPTYLPVVQLFVSISWPITKPLMTRPSRFANGAHIPMKPHTPLECMRSLILEMMLNTKIKLKAESAKCATFGLKQMAIS